MTHIRVKVPPKGGNSFYRDRSDRSALARTLCGAAVTDRDVDFRTGATKRFRATAVAVACGACVAKQDEALDALLASHI